MASDLFNIEVERNIIRALIQDKEFLRDSIIYGRVDETHFVDLFHLDSFKTIKQYYKKYGMPLTQEKFKQYISKNTTLHEKFKSKNDQREIWKKSSERLFVKVDQETLEYRQSDLDVLDELRKARLAQEIIMKATNEFENENYQKCFNIFSNGMISSQKMDPSITEGDIVSDYDQNMNWITMKQMGHIRPVRSNLPIIYDYMDSDSRPEGDSRDFRLTNLDEELNGGFHNGDLTLIIGENNVGKSMALMNLAYNASITEKRNVVMFTIEMSKMKQEFRIYSRLTGIPHTHFRTGEINKSDEELLKRKLDWWKENAGMFYIVAFDQGATVDDVAAKMKGIEDKTGNGIDFVVIDYLNDMTPTGKFQHGKSWDAMGSISWDLAKLCKYWNEHKGIPIVTANQKKDDSDTLINWGDIGYGKIVGQHCSVGIGLSSSDVDDGFQRLRMNIWKHRDGQKGQVFYVYPDFAKAKLSSIKKISEYYSLDDEYEE